MTVWVIVFLGCICILLSMKHTRKPSHLVIDRKRNNNDERVIRSFNADTNAKRSVSEKIADTLTSKFGSMLFLSINIIWFGFWIVINLGIIPGINAFDPYPFGFLTMVVSLEAIILAIVVLVSQNRAATIADVREEVTLQMDIIIERELTKTLQLVAKIADKQGIDLSHDPELKTMLKAIDVTEIEEILEDEIAVQ